MSPPATLLSADGVWQRKAPSISTRRSAGVLCRCGVDDVDGVREIAAEWCGRLRIGAGPGRFEGG